MNWRESLTKLLEYALELFLPRSKMVREIEMMSPETLRRKTKHPAENLPKDTLALFDYGNPIIRRAIWELKYRGNKKIARLLADCLYEELAEELTERKTFETFDRPILIPIPLSRERQRERGFNQCELLVVALTERDGGNFFEPGANLLVKNRNTESQTKKNRSKRLINLKNCFSVPHPEKISGRNIILLDDVVTTGATFEEARKTLIRAGARKILAVAVAH